jgi:3-hydroxyisobutyrate dehydrogenase
MTREEQAMKAPGTVAILGLGEVGGALASILAETTRVIAIDPADRKAKARELGIDHYAAPGIYLEAAEVILSAVTGEQAVPAARVARPFLRAGAVYADLNTAPKETMTRVEGLLEPGGITCIDIAVMSIIGAPGVRFPPMLASGTGAADLAAWLEPLGFIIRVIEGAVGDASAVKMMRSIFMKGMEALTVECFAAAEHYGLSHLTIENLADLDRIPIASTVDSHVTSHPRHAARRLGEVIDAEAMLRRDGFDPIMTSAARAFFERTVTGDPLSGDTAKPDFATSLKCLRSLTGPRG